MKNVILVMALAMAPIVSALGAARHLSLVSSVPAEDAQLTTAPTEIRLAFSGPVEASKVEITLVGPDKRPVSLKGAQAVERYRHMAVAAITGTVMANGKYTVRWRTVAADGDPASGSFSFMYMPPPAKH